MVSTTVRSADREDFFKSCRPRITAATLHRNIGKCVTMLGTVESSHVAVNKLSFHLFVGDQFVEVLLQIPFPTHEMLNDIVEVTGNVDKQCRLQCIFYRKLKSKIPFQLSDYNKTIDLIAKHPDCFHY